MERIDRRAFIKRSLNVGAGMALCALFSHPFLRSSPAVADELKEEQKKEKSAKYVFNFCSEYFTADYLTTPHALQQIKALVEKYTENKIYVKIHDGGAQGFGSSLSSLVKFGLAQGALLSVSNLAPMVKEVDILNIPFWSAGVEQYLRLFNSRTWQEQVLSQTKNFNLTVLFPYVVGARTASTLKIYGKVIKAPEDFSGVRFRIPGSASLRLFYELAHARPLKIDWGRCAKAARAKFFDALDPAIVGLYAGPDGLNREIGVISTIESVHDGWVAIGNNHFIAGLDTKTRAQFLDAFKEVQTEQVKLYERAQTRCIHKFEKMGARIYTPTEDEKKRLAQTFGPANPAWEPVKKRLLGENGQALFDKLYQIAQG